MRYKKIVLSIIASVLCIGLLNSCGYENEISIKIENIGVQGVQTR